MFVKSDLKLQVYFMYIMYINYLNYFKHMLVINVTLCSLKKIMGFGCDILNFAPTPAVAELITHDLPFRGI